MQTKTHFSITQASILALFGAIVTQVIAYVPAWAAYKAQIISGGGIVIAAVFLIANGIAHLAASHVSGEELKRDALDVVHGELGKVDFNALVRDAVDAKGLPDISQMVRDEVQRILSGAFGSVTVASSPAVTQTQPAPVTFTSPE